MKLHIALSAIALCGFLGTGQAGWAEVSPQEAAQLKTTLTPLGAEKAGNKDGTIPAWTGAYTTPISGFVNGGRRLDPFADEKPLFSITGKNVDQYADKLTDGVKAMLKKYPDYRIDVYPTHRTAGAPQWVYANTFTNATKAKLDGFKVEDAFGGIPFPIPKSGAEAMWNHLLRWRGEAWHIDAQGMLITADGQLVMANDSQLQQTMPYYLKDHPEKFTGDYWEIRMLNSGPPIRAGEMIVGRENVDFDHTQAWVYLTGQRRVRKLPNPCCDAPTPASAGLRSFDSTEVYAGRMDRFDWTIVGKKEMYIPYNTNRLLQPTNVADVVGPHFLNPDHVRWELHRVWVIEADLAQGKRHQAPKNKYYLDEDTWMAVLADRWDANGQLWQTMWNMPIVMPDLPGVVNLSFGFYDLVASQWFADNIYNGKTEQYKIMPPYDDTVFTPESMAGEGVR